MPPGNGHAFEQLAVSSWERVFRDKSLTPAEQSNYIDKGIEAASKALDLDAECATALLVKSMLRRMQASAEANVQRRHELVEEADALHNSAELLAKRKISGL